ncbi:VOC family protein [Cupriavidus taiwanensis]|uniref:VOC family protein n=1 Tax=Cupriavidus taiwanensis TaxID=164546 RepID=UPI0039C1FE58
MQQQSIDSIFRPRRLGHVNFIVENLQRSIDFYQQACGLNLEFTESGIRAGFMGVGHTPHDVGIMEQTHEARYGRDGHLQIPKGAVSKIGLNHLAWEMESEAALVASWNRAVAEGKSPRTVDHQIARSVYLRDPDGNMNEFYADTIVDWRSVLHGDIELITSSWTPGTPPPAAAPRWHADPETRRFDGGVMQPKKLSHAALITQDLSPMVEFYTSIAGLEIVCDTPDLVLLRPSATPSLYQLALVLGEEKGLHHFGFEVESDTRWEDSAKRLQSLGCKVVDPLSGPLKTSIFAVDPDGYRVEFCIPKGPDLEQLQRIKDPIYLV